VIVKGTFPPFLPPFKRRHHCKRIGRCKGKDVLPIIRRSIFAAATLVACSLLTPLQASAAAGCGGASWYALHSKTASGERMNPSTLTAAHRSLRFGTKVMVTNKRNGKSVIVRINDRGPFIRGRVLDLSKAAAGNIDMVSTGTASVCYQVVS
jgi:rare lipoprotein A